MAISSFSWLDYSTKSLAQTVFDWNSQHDVQALEAWLLQSNGHVGPYASIEFLTPELMAEFVQGVEQCSDEAIRAYQLPIDWPRETILQTQILRDGMLNVEPWSEQADEDTRGANELGFVQLLYPTQRSQQMLASSMYSPSTEALRLHLGMPVNDAWWQRLPLRSQAEKDLHQQSCGWENLLREILARPEPKQGLRIALMMELLRLQAQERKEQGEQSVFVEPTVAHVLASNIEGKMALALWQALNCPRDKIPESSWWTQWDEWCNTEPEEAQLALATLLLVRTGPCTVDQVNSISRHVVERLVSLRDPPVTYALAHVFSERKKYASWSIDELVGRTLPVKNRTLRFFDGLGTVQEQLLCNYEALLQKTQPKLGFDDVALDHLFMDGPTA